MTNPYNGEVYNTETLDPEGRVSLFWPASGTVSVSLSSSVFMDSGRLELPTNSHPLIGLIDNGGERECLVADEGVNAGYVSTLRIYKVELNGGTGTSISLSSFDSITPTIFSGSAPAYFGIKKSSDTVYNTYYCSLFSDAGQQYFQFRKITLNPGVGHTDDLIEDIPLDTAGATWYYGAKKVIGKIGYIGLLKCYSSENYPYGFDVYIYQIDMKTENITGGLVWQSGGTPSHFKSYMAANVNARPLAFSASMGELHWATYYVDDASNTVGGTPLIFHIVVDGEDTITFDTVSNDWIGVWSCVGFNGSASGGGSNQVNGVVCQYNTRDFLCVCGFLRNPSSGMTHRTLVSSNGVITTEFDPTTSIYQHPSNYSTSSGYVNLRSFTSEGEFPAFVSITGTFHHVDVDTGQPISQFTVPSAGSNIFTVFPVLDIYDGSVYMEATTTQLKIIGVDPDTGGVTNNIQVILLSNGLKKIGYNMGNWFVTTRSGIQINYLINPLPDDENQVQMIIEQN